jgi:serine/threonine protein kinase
METTTAPPLKSGMWSLTEPLEGTVFLTADPAWVVKRLTINTAQDETATETCDELEAILAVFNNRHRLRNCLEFPRTLSDFCGVERDHAWFAMRRYDGPLSRIQDSTTDPDFWSRHWRRLAVQVLAFLEDYHTVCRRVHMDIKGTNILVRQESCQFVVADFGLSCFQGRKPLSAYSANYLWYYLEFGAELEKPIASWRFDLTALGFLLARLSWNPEHGETFIEMCRVARREGPGSLIPAIVVAKRSMEMARGISPLLYAYFDMVDAISWFEPEPPPRLFYRSLSSLFS